MLQHLVDYNSQDPYFSIIDHVITRQIAAVNSSSEPETPMDLFIGATGKVDIHLSGAPAFILESQGSLSILKSAEGKTPNIQGADSSNTVFVGALEVKETATTQVIETKRDLLEFQNNVHVHGTQLIDGDVLNFGRTITQSMNVVRSMNNGNRIGYGFRVDDQSNLELFKYDDERRLTKRIMVFGQGTAGVDAVSDTLEFPVFGEASTVDYRIDPTPWVSACNLVYVVPTKRVAVGTSNAEARLHIVTQATDTLSLLVQGSNAVPLLAVEASNGFIGVGTSNPMAAVDVRGDVKVDTMITTTDLMVNGSFTFPSDSRLKENVRLADVDELYGVIRDTPLYNFEWTDTDGLGMPTRMPTTTQLGWIAQELELIYPHSVKKHNVFGYMDLLSVEPDAMLKAMHGCLQVLMRRVEALENARSVAAA
jgi:hypothetical protein